jgi:outer membrane immunogenic protein
MRRFVVAAIMAVAAPGAHAADLPDWADAPILRGGLSSSTANWQGAYVGLQYGYSHTNFDANSIFAHPSFQNLAAGVPFADTGFAVNPNFDKTSGGNFGGFIGYNGQWDDVILGVDLNYNIGGQRVSVIGVSPATGVDPITVTTGTSVFKITDYGAARVRAGWVINNFLPYGTLGVALGRADLTNTVTVASTPASPTAFGPVTASQNKNGSFLYGYSYGGGLDFLLTAGLFLRGEVEVTRFTTLHGVDSTVTSGRAGLGYRF